MSNKLRQQLEEWNQNDADYPKNLCIHQLFESQVECTPDNIAVIFDEQRLTYWELNQRANQLAHHLQMLGVGPEVLVGICIKRSLDMVIGLLAILKAGGAYLPLDPTYPQERLALMIEDSQIPVLLTEQDQLTRLPAHQSKVVCVDTDWETIAKSRKDNLNSEVNPDNLAYTIYTSGSTGKPKGVQILHRGVVNFLTSMSQTPGLTHHDVFLAVTTISFDIAILELFLPLTVGARVVLVTREVACDAAQLLKVMAQSSPTVMQATPATWRMLLATGWQGSSRLKILCGGEAMPRTLANELLKRSASLWNMYGPTETTIWSAVYKVEPGDTPVSIGRPIANTQIYLVEPHLNGKNNPIKLVPVGEPGELLIGGVGLARGYLNRPELTEEKFISVSISDRDFSGTNTMTSRVGDSSRHSMKEAESRLYRTGDLARYLPDGNIEYIGRIDHQVKIRGFRIELGEIETVLYQHPLVREAVVIAQEQKSGSQRLVAYFVSKPRLQQLQQQSTDILQLRSFLKEKLPEYMVPTAFVAMEALPLTPNGKVDRRALPAFSQTRPDSETMFVPPRTPMEQQLVQIWKQVLSLEQVGIYNNFFELGGHSLLAAQLLAQVRETFQVELPLLSLFDAPTVAGLAQAIAALSVTLPNVSNSTTKVNSISVADLQADAVLDSTIYPEAPFIGSCEEPQRIFLTGASGFVGAFLLHELLQKTQASIYCLVRSSSLDEAKQKLASNLKRYLLPHDELNTRIIPVLGDLSQPLLGLSKQQFHQLATEIDFIYHNGAFVNLIYPYTALRAANVLGSKEILKLASQIKVKPVHFISTLDVFQSPHYTGMQVVLEQDDLACCEGLSDGYAQSKWVAEKLMMAAQSRGIPTCIYRLGSIIGHSQTGASQIDDLVARLIKGMIQLNSAPKLNLKLSLTPVDYVSKAIVHLSRQSGSLGKAFHLVNPHALPLYQLVNEIQALGYSIQWTDYEQWQAQLVKVAAKQENALSPLLFLLTQWNSQNQLPYLETAALVSQAFDCQNTLTGLTGTDVVCPPINTQVLRAYFAYLGLTS
ncbi:phenylalanine racemase [Nostocales cyanobacterium HT-58-2]|nr:phenylalanine racemase [Nostocales cyanobacterium HT-58-2]